MSKEQLLQELADAFEKLIGTATEAAQRGVTRKGDTWGPREIVAHLAGWEVIATVRIPKIAAGMPPFEEADETRQAVMDDAINATIVSLFPFLCTRLDAYNCSKGLLGGTKTESLRKSFLVSWIHIIAESQNWTHKPSESCR